MQITINFTNTDRMEIQRVANELHVAPKIITTKLKNIYLANFNDDLQWIAEMLEEDRNEVK